MESKDFYDSNSLNSKRTNKSRIIALGQRRTFWSEIHEEPIMSNKNSQAWQFSPAPSHAFRLHPYYAFVPISLYVSLWMAFGIKGELEWVQIHSLLVGIQPLRLKNLKW